MAHFMVTCSGNRGEASRLGGKESGVSADLNGWNGGVRVYLYHDADTGQDMARVTLTPGSGHSGGHRELYDGPVNAEARERVTA